VMTKKQQRVSLYMNAVYIYVHLLRADSDITRPIVGLADTEQGSQTTLSIP
jgi:hypothetical protein